ncbi:uncharacterized protein LOC129900732 isoform X2 [Solanum dulcamara]|uniref:uncharacterized protein LOC129900732 isoform X2 n=1 Tax=Solanum dulcamara TaxID=45834 RepID=UPI00248606F0|nr:uncharacterized protein LOC129900732 isoform X2 [Solanum dulcamara]
MMASYSSVLRGKEEKGFPPPHKLFPSHGFAMEEQKQKKKVQDFNLKGTGASGYEEQSTDGLRKVKANWGNDSIFGTYGLSEHSSSSGLSSPFGSELGSTETDETESEEDEDFIAQLTRQMADYMLKDDDDEEEDVSVDENDADENRAPSSTLNNLQTPNTYGLAGNWSNLNSKEICCYNQESLGTYVKPVEDSVNHQIKNSNSVFYSSDDLKRPIQVYHLKDQPTTAKLKKRMKGTASVRKLKTEKNNTESSLTKKQTVGRHGQSGDKIHQLHPQHPVQGSGAAMRAIFLGGSGLKKGSSGTGVFLPRTINNPNPPPTATTESKKKKKSDAENEAEELVYKENQHSEDQTIVVNDQEVQLPQEWTY